MFVITLRLFLLQHIPPVMRTPVNFVQVVENQSFSLIAVTSKTWSDAGSGGAGLT